jgi:glycolate oxidase FAD binding subunit
MLALDPPLGADMRATIGGVVATGDSGPLRHRYGGARDLVIGMTVALGDGTVARSGGKVIKNVAGCDLAKLFCGSFGTLGMILAVNLRLSRLRLRLPQPAPQLPMPAYLKRPRSSLRRHRSNSTRST